MPLEKPPPKGAVSEWVNSPRVREVVLGTVPYFIDFHIHLPTFLWQLRCFVERIIRKRLTDSFIRNSAIVRVLIILTYYFSELNSMFLCQFILHLKHLQIRTASTLSRRDGGWGEGGQTK